MDVNLPGEQPHLETDGPARVSLATLAAQRGAGSPALARVAPQAAGARRGRTTAGGFQSCV